MHRKISSILVFSLLCGCGHTQIQTVGLLSMGDLEGKKITDDVYGKTLEGSSCGASYFLSNAVRDALEGTEFDTMIDVEVTNETGLFITSNCITVKGKAIDSKTLVSNIGEK